MSSGVMNDSSAFSIGSTAHMPICRIVRTALQPVLDSVYRTHAGHMQSDIEAILRRAGRGSFSKDNIDGFAGYIARGDRPVLIGNPDASPARSRHRRSPAEASR